VTTSTAIAQQGRVVQHAAWLLREDGLLEAQFRFEPEGKLPPLPRLGIVMHLAGRLERVEWFGRGPHENYPDRKDSAEVGRYNGTVSTAATPYPRPQETGSRQDVRWVALRDAAGAGLLVVAPDDRIAFSALPYTAHDLAAARRWCDLVPRQETILSLDAAQCGLGNSSCGPGVLAEYAVLPEPRTLRLLFARLKSHDDSGVVARGVIARTQIRLAAADSNP
jgi:beta-galactosidase